MENVRLIQINLLAYGCSASQGAADGDDFAIDGKIGCRAEGDEPVAIQQAPVYETSSSGQQLFLSTTVIPPPDGSSLTRVELDDGVSITSRFTDEAEARQYPVKLARWLRERQGT